MGSPQQPLYEAEFPPKVGAKNDCFGKFLILVEIENQSAKQLAVCSTMQTVYAFALTAQVVNETIVFSLNYFCNIIWNF